MSRKDMLEEDKRVEGSNHDDVISSVFPIENMLCAQ